MPRGVYIRSEKTKKLFSFIRKGRKDSIETRIRKSICKSGPNHPAWEGGISIGDNRKYYMKNKRDYYYKINGEKEREQSRLRMINRRSQEGKITKAVLQLLYEDNIKKYGTLTCYLCLKNIEFGKDNIEHKIPISRGGNNLYNNLSISCKSCNCKKRIRTLEEYQFSRT